MLQLHWANMPYVAIVSGRRVEIEQNDSGDISIYRTQFGIPSTNFTSNKRSIHRKQAHRWNELVVEKC